MSEQIEGTLEILNSTPSVTIILTGDDASVKAGNSGVAGLMEVNNSAGNRVFQVHGDDGTLTIGVSGNAGQVMVRDSAERPTLQLNGDNALLTVGSNGNGGAISVVNAAGNNLFQLDSTTGMVTIGASGGAGNICLRDGTGTDRIQLDGGMGDIWVKSTAGHNLLHFDSSYAALYLGGQGNEGDLIVRDEGNRERIKLDGGMGDIWVKSTAGHNLLHFDSSYAALYLGGQGNEGDLIVRDEENRERIKLDGGMGDIWVKSTAGHNLLHFDSSYAALYLGGQGNEGDLIVRDEENRERIKLDGGMGDIWVKSTAGHNLLHFDSSYAALYLGGQGNEGDLIVRDEENRERIKLDGGMGDIWVKSTVGHNLLHFDSSYAALYLGGQGNEGDLIVRDEENRERIKLDGGMGDIWVKSTTGHNLLHFDSSYAALYLGGQGNEGDVIVRNGSGNETIKLDGGSGDIILTNADCAEEFDFENACDVSPGSVMVIGDEERLTISTKAYDKRVAGVISGAGAYKPGLILDRKDGENNRVPIALMGKVFCKVDAQYSPIEIGDLLTSSSTPGHAMKATDPYQAFGSVIGKALESLDSGTGLIPVLVSLQ